MPDFGELVYKKFQEDIGDNVSTSVEFSARDMLCGMAVWTYLCKEVVCFF